MANRVAMKNPFRCYRNHLPPPSPVPEFSSEGGGELWKLVMGLKYQFGGLEAKVNIILALLLLGVGAVLARMLAPLTPGPDILARLLGAF